MDDTGSAPRFAGSYQAIEVYNDRADKFTYGLAWHRWANRQALFEECGAPSISLYEVGLGYKFDKNLSINGAFAWTNSPSTGHELNVAPERVNSQSRRAFSIELDYKKADPAHKGSFGLFAAYRQLGHYAAIKPTYDAISHGHRGLEIGGDYVFAKNMMGTVKYFWGKKIPDEVGGIDEQLQSSTAFFA